MIYNILIICFIFRGFLFFGLTKFGSKLLGFLNSPENPPGTKKQ